MHVFGNSSFILLPLFFFSILYWNMDKASLVKDVEWIIITFNELSFKYSPSERIEIKCVGETLFSLVFLPICLGVCIWADDYLIMSTTIEIKCVLACVRIFFWILDSNFWKLLMLVLVDEARIFQILQVQSIRYGYGPDAPQYTLTLVGYRFGVFHWHFCKFDLLDIVRHALSTYASEWEVFFCDFFS